MEKKILLKIKVDCSKDELGNVIKFNGFDDKTPIQNTIELIGLLEILKQQELKRFLDKEVKD